MNESRRNPSIRPFEKRDTEAVLGLSLRAWEPVFESIEEAMGSDIFECFHPDDWRESQRKAVEAALASKETWVAESADRVSGFVALELHRESGMGEIHMLAVEPDFQKEGVGTALTEFALARMKDEGMKVAMVETGGDPGHAPARRAYEKAGYALLKIARYFKKL